MCTGGRGTGKSAVLTALAEQYAQRLPQAHADLAASDFGQPGLAALAEDETANASRTSDLLFHLQYRLSRKPAEFGRKLSFPRLTQGLLAVSGWQVEGDDNPGQAVRPEELAAAKRRLAELLRASQPDQQQRRDKAAVWVDQVVQSVGPLTGLPAAMDAMVQAMMRIVATELFSSRAHRGGLAWWTGRRVTQQGDAYDQLTELALKFRGDPEDRRLAERHLIAALLADIADHYGFLQTANGVPRPLLLLDNAHSPLGTVFLDELTRVWHEEPAGPRRTVRPVVVATALRETPPLPEDGPAPSTRRASGPFWLGSRPATAAEWMLALPLAPLDLDEVKDMFEGVHPPPGAARLILRLSGGRAGIAHALVAAVARRVRLNEAITLDGLLDIPATADPGRSVSTVLLERLIPDEVARARLTYYAPGLDDTAVHRLSSHYPPQDPGGVPVQEASAHLRDNRWGRTPWPGTEGPFVGDPALRTLLLHELRGDAGRAPGAEPWRNIHLRLRSLYDPDGQGSAARRPDTRYLHHSLALGERDLVVRSLHHRFTERDAPGWLAAVNLVCAAPRPPDSLPAPSGDAAACPVCTAGGDPVHQAVELLVSQVWELSQPLATPRAATINSIGLQLLTLAQNSGPDAQKIFFRAHEEWPRELHRWTQAPHLQTYGGSAP
ncbi:hypothetical protein [Streptomyces sp. NPDC050856]|uniref:hypothetical protein n=1 Tax=Streptomyces sp. NPDC050856 TaxID=3154939 RepID=UPI0033E48B12